MVLFQCEIRNDGQVPADWLMESEPANGDGRAFRSLDGRAQMRIFGGFRNASVKEDMAMISDPRGGVVTYKMLGKRSIVVSGVKGDRIFYRRSILSCRDGIWNNLSIEYPLSEKSKFDSVVITASNSLRSGVGVETIDCR